MQDAWRAYLEMALGLTEAPRKKAQKVAGDLVNRGGATAAQLQGLVEDLMSTGMANREALTNIVRYEVDRALGVVGLASADEVTELTSRVKDLERRLREAQGRAGTPVASTITGAGTGGDRLDKPAPTPAPGKKTVAKKAVKATPNAMPEAATTRPATKKAAATPAPAAAKKAAAKKAVQKAAPASPVKAAPASPVKAAPASPAKKTAQKATELPPAKKTAAKKAPARKSAPPAKFIDPGN
jgi:polyhydroxyalkanoate synthesis regulator phasin